MATDKTNLRWYQYRRKSLSKGLTFCTKDELKIFFKTEKICEYCLIPEEKIKIVYPDIRVKVMTVDRKDNKKGYIINNICWSCFPCNMIKSHLLSNKDMKEIGKKYIYPKWNNILKEIKTV